MLSKYLKSGYKLIPYYYNCKPNLNISEEDRVRCKKTLRQLQLDRHIDRLCDNYTVTKLKLDTMLLYNIVYDTIEDSPVFVSGTQILNNDVVRVFTRYFAFPDYRTDGTNPLQKVDDFEELKYSLKAADEYKLVIWSRDKSSGFFSRLKSGRPDVFSDWNISSSIELMFKNNYQYIFYTGDSKYLHNLQYEFYLQEKN